MKFTVGQIVSWASYRGWAERAEILAVLKDEGGIAGTSYQICYRNQIRHFIIKIVASYELTPVGA